MCQDQLFQQFGIAPETDPTGVVSHLGSSSAILVFHKDDYYHLAFEPMDVLIRFLRRRLENKSDTDCPICFEPLPIDYAHRLECTTCGMAVCDGCVVKIMNRDENKQYECPQCRDRPQVTVYTE